MSCLNDTGYVLNKDGTEVSFDALPQNFFTLQIDKLPFTLRMLQDFDFPDVSISKVNHPTPLLNLDQVGEKINYSPLVIRFLIDSKLNNYKEMFKWMKDITVLGTQLNSVSDAILTINSSTKVKFIDVWPASISGMRFSVTDNQVTYVTATAVFNYDWHEFV